MREKVICQHYLFRSGIFVETLLDQKFIHDDDPVEILYKLYLNLEIKYYFKNLEKSKIVLIHI